MLTTNFKDRTVVLSHWLSTNILYKEILLG